jgi:hypothetical protein
MKLQPDHNSDMRINWKWIRLREDLYHEIASFGKFGDSFNDMKHKCVDSYYAHGRPSGSEPTAVGRDEIKVRLKKFDSHTKAIAKIVKENISHTNQQ